MNVDPQNSQQRHDEWSSFGLSRNSPRGGSLLALHIYETSQVAVKEVGRMKAQNQSCDSKAHGNEKEEENGKHDKMT